MIAGIVAFSSNGMIGLNGLLPWEIPEEFAYFETKVANAALVVGRQTYELMFPAETDCFVVTTQPDLVLRPGYQALATVEQALLAAVQTGKDVYVIGGASIYAAAWPYCERFYVTRIEGEFEGDTKFPESVPLDQWTVVSDEKKTFMERQSSTPVTCRFMEYRQQLPRFLPGMDCKNRVAQSE
ncbi:MAG: dihydrofolate reductase [Rhodocyclaceae bacterium]|nr:dihydrofolate reductase [Rhodocyclaceae bacterium]